MDIEIAPRPEDLIRAEYNKGIKHQEKSMDDPCAHSYWQGRIDTALAIANKLGIKI